MMPMLPMLMLPMLLMHAATAEANTGHTNFPSVPASLSSWTLSLEERRLLLLMPPTLQQTLPMPRPPLPMLPMLPRRHSEINAANDAKDRTQSKTPSYVCCPHLEPIKSILDFLEAGTLHLIKQESDLLFFSECDSSLSKNPVNVACTFVRNFSNDIVRWLL
jgi:hypothetical protein